MKTILSRLLIERSISSTVLARAIRASDSQVCHWRKCRMWVPPKYHKALAEFLGVPIEEIIDPKTNLPRFIEEV
ncbi:helix-turn-helix domain-containing protein [Aminobacterium colombiense]|uniref:helix-turn-helix domain-containing protein n=1 Tax=Aminobacterium colombiense TaxID=81468 RepID=UPI00332866AD